MTRISVIIPTFERGNIFNECLSSVLESISDQDEIIIVNDSKQNTLELHIIDSRVILFNNPKSGVASARNLGASHAKGKYLLFIDDDMLINRDSVESCFQLILKSSNSVINSDWVYNPADLAKMKKTQFGRYLDRIEFTSLKGWCPNLVWKTNDVVRAKGITSQFLLIAKSVFEDVSGYNEHFPFAGFEDYDLGKKLELNNVQFLINTKCCVFHNEKDRMALKPFLERKKRGALTRKKGVELGYSELNIHFNPLKRFYFLFSFLTKPLFFFLINITPNSKTTDTLYRFWVNRLMGIYIFQGFNQLK